MSVLRRASSHAALITALCFGVSLIEGVDLQAVGVAVPKMMPALGLSPYQAGLMLTSGVAGLVVGASVGGLGVDRWGRKRVLLSLVALFTLCTLVTPFIQGLQPLMAVRFFAGLGLGGGMPCLIAIGSDIAEPGNRARIVTRMFAGSPLGGAIISAFARVILKHWGWKALFVAGGIPSLLMLPVLAALLPETGTPVHEADAMPLSRLLWRGGRAPVTALIWLIFGADLIALYMLLNWLPGLVTARGLSVETGAMAALWFNLGAASGVVSIGILTDKFGPSRPIPAAFAFLMVAMGGLALFSTPLPIMICSTVAGFTVVGGLCTLYGVVPVYYPPAGRASAVGSAVAAGRVASICGPYLPGVLLQLGLGAPAVALAMMPVALAAAIFATILPGQARRAARN